MNNSSGDAMYLLRDFCSDFGFDIQDCLLLYLQTVIKTWNPQLNISNLNGRKGRYFYCTLILYKSVLVRMYFLELRIQEDEVNELNTKCNAIVAKVSDKVALKNCIASIYSQVRPFHVL